LGGLLVLFFLVFKVGIATLCSLVGLAYPAYKSFQAIETKVKGDIVQWQAYWIIFSVWQFVEIFENVVVYWIPFYYAFKLAFLLWLMLPQTKGAMYVYDHLLKDFLKKQSKIDAALSEAKKQSNSIASDFNNTHGADESEKDK
jgi:receptor expression-enhancing protein 5/6